MITQLGHALLMVAGFLTALGALLALLDRIETSLYDAVATRSDSPNVPLAALHDDPVALPEPRRPHADRQVIAYAPEHGVASRLPG